MASGRDKFIGDNHSSTPQINIFAASTTNYFSDEKMKPMESSRPEKYSNWNCQCVTPPSPLARSPAGRPIRQWVVVVPPPAAWLITLTPIYYFCNYGNVPRAVWDAWTTNFMWRGGDAIRVEVTIFLSCHVHIYDCPTSSWFSIHSIHNFHA